MRSTNYLYHQAMPNTGAEIARLIKRKPNNVYMKLKELQNEGLVLKDHNRVYQWIGPAPEYPGDVVVKNAPSPQINEPEINHHWNILLEGLKRLEKDNGTPTMTEDEIVEYINQNQKEGTIFLWCLVQLVKAEANK